MKKVLYLTKKRILIIVFILIMLLVILFVYLNVNKRHKINIDANKQDYIVTEYFAEKDKNSSKTYEVRYDTGKKESYLILTEKNGVKTNKTITEIKTEFTNEYAGFKIDNRAPLKAASLEQYADDSGFVYKCRTEEIQAFLTNEAAGGKIRFLFLTPDYLECYIEKKEGNIMRGLLLYNTDAETGTLIYKQCKKDIDIPTALESVTEIKNGKE